MYCTSAVINVFIAIIRPTELHSGKYPCIVQVSCYMLRHPDFTLYALNYNINAEHKSVHRGNKEVKGRFERRGLVCRFPTL